MKLFPTQTIEISGPLCESWARALTEPPGADWITCTHDSCWAIATGNPA
jgi:sugar (pentulose or hexulose) kinase